MLSRASSGRIDQRFHLRVPPLFADMTDAASSPSRRNIIIVLLLAVVAGGWWWMKKPGVVDDAKNPRKGGVMAVTAAPVRKADAPLQLSALGTVSALNTVTVHSRVDGQLQALHFEEGQMVKQGQLLAELDPRPYQASLMQAEGQLLRDQALLLNAQQDLARYKQLLAQNSIAKQQVDTQDALVKQYQGTVKLDQGSVASARLQLDYSRVAAPVSGRVGLRQVDPGNIVKASDANGIVVITQTRPINVQFSVPEVSLTSVLKASKEAGGKLAVEAWDRDNHNKLAEGVLLAIDNQLNASTGTVALKARFANEDDALFPNQFVNVHLKLGNQKDAVVVPTVALQLGKGGSIVYTLNADETVSVNKVQTGPVSGENTIIVEGVKPGQQVVVDGLDKLRDGAKVKVVAARPDAAGDAGGKGKRRKHDASGNKSASSAQ